MSDLFNETTWSLVNTYCSLLDISILSQSISHLSNRLSFISPIPRQSFENMPASRDDDVYQAKLAEQAERYEGK